MANILIYDEITFKVKEYLKSVNTPDYSSRTDVLVHPDISTLDGIPMKHWKVSGGLVIEMTQEEKDTILQDEDDAQMQSVLNDIDNFEVTNLDLLTALIKRINVRIPSNLITKQEIIDQIKLDRGL